MDEGLRKQLIEQIATNFGEVATVCTTSTCNGGDETTVSPPSEEAQTQGDKPGGVILSKYYPIQLDLSRSEDPKNPAPTSTTG